MNSIYEENQDVVYGGCIYCGQILQLLPEKDETASDLEKLSTAEKDRRATHHCTCDEARRAVRREMQLTQVREVINDEFADDDYGIRDLLIQAAALMERGWISNMQVKDCDGVVIKLSRNDKGEFKLNQTQKKVKERKI